MTEDLIHCLSSEIMNQNKFNKMIWLVISGIIYFNSSVDISGTVVGEGPDYLLLSGTMVGENRDHICWER